MEKAMANATAMAKAMVYSVDCRLLYSTMVSTFFVKHWYAWDSYRWVFVINIEHWKYIRLNWTEMLIYYSLKKKHNKSERSRIDWSEVIHVDLYIYMYIVRMYNVLCVFQYPLCSLQFSFRVKTFIRPFFSWKSCMTTSEWIRFRQSL